jgi:uncharacterized protein (TIGR03083 family)
MQTECDDLGAEVAELAQLCAGLSDAQWATPTDFYGWSAWDEVAHLCYFDETALLATRDAEAFAQHAAELMQLMNSGGHISAVAREHFAGLGGAALLARWAGFLTRQRLSIATNSGDQLAGSLSEGAGSVGIKKIAVSGETCACGGWPSAISMAVIPSDHTSASMS